MVDQIQIWSFLHQPFYPIIRQKLKDYGITAKIPLGHSFKETQECPDITTIEKGDLIVFSTVILYDPKHLSKLVSDALLLRLPSHPSQSGLPLEIFSQPPLATFVRGVRLVN